jgi:hypothetical protein
VIDRGTNQAKPRRKHAKYLDTRSGRIRPANIADNSAASIEAFVKANVKRGTTLLTTATLPIPDCPPITGTIRARSARWRAISFCRGFIVLRADEAVGAGHESWPSPQARRHISRRIRVSQQSPLLPASLVRNVLGLAAHH